MRDFESSAETQFSFDRSFMSLSLPSPLNDRTALKSSTLFLQSYSSPSIIRGGLQRKSKKQTVLFSMNISVIDLTFKCTNLGTDTRLWTRLSIESIDMG